MAWRSFNMSRTVPSSLGAEAQAMSVALRFVEWATLFLQELIHGPFDLQGAPAVMQERPPVCVTDCKSLYDHLSAVGSPSTLQDKAFRHRRVDYSRVLGRRQVVWYVGHPLGCSWRMVSQLTRERLWSVSVEVCGLGRTCSDESEQTDSEREESNSGTVRIGLMVGVSSLDCRVALFRGYGCRFFLCWYQCWFQYSAAEVYGSAPRFLIWGMSQVSFQFDSRCSSLFRRWRVKPSRCADWWVTQSVFPVVLSAPNVIARRVSNCVLSHIVVRASWHEAHNVCCSQSHLDGVEFELLLWQASLSSTANCCGQCEKQRGILVFCILLSGDSSPTRLLIPLSLCNVWWILFVTVANSCLSHPSPWRPWTVGACVWNPLRILLSLWISSTREGCCTFRPFRPFFGLTYCLSVIVQFFNVFSAREGERLFLKRCPFRDQRKSKFFVSLLNVFCGIFQCFFGFWHFFESIQKPHCVF